MTVFTEQRMKRLFEPLRTRNKFGLKRSSRNTYMEIKAKRVTWSGHVKCVGKLETHTKL